MTLKQYLFMRKSMLFSAIIGALIFMTSCLGEVSSNYADTTFVYIDSDDVGTTYGKTISLYGASRAIVSNQMVLMNPNRFKIMAYKWEEEYGTKPLRLDGQIYQADYVQLTGEPIDVYQTYLRFTPLPEVEEHLSFLEVAPPIFAHSPKFMGDNWLFQFSYEIPKGQLGIVDFYKRDQTEELSTDVVIDLHLTHTGTPSGTTVERVTDYLALNMSSLRSQYVNSDKEELKIKFVYHLKDRTEPVESQAYTLMLKEN